MSVFRCEDALVGNLDLTGQVFETPAWAQAVWVWAHLRSGDPGPGTIRLQLDAAFPLTADGSYDFSDVVTNQVGGADLAAVGDVAKQLITNANLAALPFGDSAEYPPPPALRMRAVALGGPPVQTYEIDVFYGYIGTPR